MKKLCGDIVRSYEDRRELIESLRSAHEEMGHRLMDDLSRSRKELIAENAARRDEFQKKAKAIREDLEEARRLWNVATGQLEEMRRKRKG